MDYLYIIIPVVLLLLIAISIIVFHFKKKAVIKKVRSLSTAEKNQLLDELAEPVGYTYEACQDIFVSRVDAPQKIFGYNTLYDFSAPYFNMIFDYETIYFDYRGRTWLIEMWKGQYGINTGCELGIYYADEVISPEQYNSTHFKAVDARDMLDISLKLNRRRRAKRSTKKTAPAAGNTKQASSFSNSQQYTQLGHVQSRHWWLTIFNMGKFTKPKELFVNTAIRFRDYPMMYNFLDSFRQTLPDTTYKVSGLTVYFTFAKSNRKYSFFRRMVRRIALLSCRIYCKWFNYLTRPFQRSGDKLVYAYYYLPFIVRRMFRQRNKKSVPR